MRRLAGVHSDGLITEPYSAPLGPVVPRRNDSLSLPLLVGGAAHGIGTGVAAAALIRLLEMVQHVVWNGSGTHLLDAAGTPVRGGTFSSCSVVSIPLPLDRRPRMICPGHNSTTVEMGPAWWHLGPPETLFEVAYGQNRVRLDRERRPRQQIPTLSRQTAEWIRCSGVDRGDRASGPPSRGCNGAGGVRVHPAATCGRHNAESGIYNALFPTLPAGKLRHAITVSSGHERSSPSGRKQPARASAIR